MAFFRKAADIFALDIGSSSVKALQLREAGGSYRLTALGTASLPPDAIADGSIKDAATVIEAIRSAVSKAGIKARESAIAISGRELIIKKVQIPEVPPRDVHPVVQLEAEHHIPFAIDEVFLDYHTVGQHGGVMDLILVAVKKSKVLEYASAVSEAGFEPSIVDVDGFALGNQFELNFPEERAEAVALIDIGFDYEDQRRARRRHHLRPRHPLRWQQLHPGNRAAAQDHLRAGGGGQARPRRWGEV